MNNGEMTCAEGGPNALGIESIIRKLSMTAPSHSGERVTRMKWDILCTLARNMQLSVAETWAGAGNTSMSPRLPPSEVNR